MDLSTSANGLSLFVPLVSVLFLSFLFLIYKQYSSSSKTRPCPPGPKPWPIIGNVLDIAGTKPHISMTHLAQIHGELISLKLGTQLVVVGSSPMAASAILKTHDVLFSARHVPESNPFKRTSLQSASLVWASDCNENWKFLRTMCRTELFSAKAIESQSHLREKKVGEMMEFLGCKEGKVVNIGEVVFTSVFNTVANHFFSKDLLDLEDEGDGSGVKGILWRLMKLATKPNISDFYPSLAWLDLQGLRRESFKALHELFGMWESLINERRQKTGLVHASSKQDFLDVFLANGLSNDQINIIASNLFTAGTDTTATTIEWAMAELLRNKDVLAKVSEELKQGVKTDSMRESDITQLPYLQACVKETLRLHPPVPFLLPHRALETCQVLNYTVPVNARILVNVWAIGRDPKVWDDPLSFKPERFLDLDLDFKGHDFEFLPFGSGRRICPGIPMASRSVPLVLASLIHSFDWGFPNGEDPAKLDMDDKFSITLQKKQPLLVVPKRKSS